MRTASFLGDSRERPREFPPDARGALGVELLRVQTGLEPNDRKPTRTIGPGVREIRARVPSGAFRVAYVLVAGERVLVLHAFEKRSEKTPRRDLDLAARRLRAWRGSDDAG